MADQPVSMDMLGLTAQIVAAHVSNNPVPQDGLPALIQDVYRTLSTMGKDAAPAVAEKPQPAVPLKRHLKTAYNMTPEQYRERWGLPADYPMVAPAYARHRSSLAKKIGLGTSPRAAKK